MNIQSVILGSASLVCMVVAAPAHANDYPVHLTAFVPIQCELSVDPSFTDMSGGEFRIATISQFCNTRYEMTMTHAALAQPAQARFRNDAVNLGSGFSVMQAAGDPVNSAADLFLTASSQADAQLFAESLTLSVTPTGL
jgi:hypothetical protein